MCSSSCPAILNAASRSLGTLSSAHAEPLLERSLDASRGARPPGELSAALDDGLGDADAVAHRIVHGGDRFSQAVRVDPTVCAALEQLIDLAPLHQPNSLAALDAASRALPDLPAVACFDTAFHATVPPAASTYALPARWRARWNVRRYGFHGLSQGISRGAP